MVLLIVLSIGTSIKAFLKGVEVWKKETIMKKEAAKWMESSGTSSADVECPGLEVTVFENVYWKEFGLLVFVWVAYLVLQIVENHTATCSTAFWVLNLLQIPVSLGVSGFVALVSYCTCGMLAGIVGGLLGLGGGFVMGPLFLELGIPPQVASATATFGMTFSSSMSVVEYYLLKRFPVPYALFFTVVATVAAFIGQHIVRKLTIMFGGASLIIFILAFTIFVSAISLGGVGISSMIGKIHRGEYMGFENLCKYDA
ncbi:hypothetical protein SLE2022_187320 [Rubroshorea leprosula]